MRKAKPIIDQVVEVLAEDIRQEKYLANPRLPSEKELARQLGVSRTTVRTALAKLESEGLVTRRQGDGTFVNQRVMDDSILLGGKWDFNYMVESSGRELQVECLHITLEEIPEGENCELDLTEDRRVIVLERIFYGDQEPLIHSTNIFPHALYISDTSVEELDHTLPIHDLIAAYFGQQISYSVSDISAVLSQEKHRETLAIKPGTPIFEFDDVFYNAQETPLMIGHNFLNDKVLRLQVAQSWG